MSTAAFRNFVDAVRLACEEYLGATETELLRTSPPAAKKPSVKGNPRCKCGHGYTVHEAPRDGEMLIDGKKVPINICRGCEADGSKLGCPEFVSKRGGAIVATREPGVPPKELRVDGEFSPIERAILAALFVNRFQTAHELSMRTVFTRSGSFNAAIADLREFGLIEGSPKLTPTDKGMRAAAIIKPTHVYTAVALRVAWKEKLSSPLASKMIDALAARGIGGLTNYGLAEACACTQSGTFNKMLAYLRRAGIVRRGQPIRLCEELS